MVARRPSLLVLLAFVVATPAFARLGETLPELKKRFGPPAPMVQPSKDRAAWLFEGEDGQLMYTVTFDAGGHSVAEGLKPLKLARFTKHIAMDFIESQVEQVRDSKTLRVVKTGEAYKFSGKDYVCGAKEYVIVDDTRGILVVWSQEGVPFVMAVAGSR